MPTRAETHVAPHDPKYRERFERLRELVTLSTCPVPVQDPKAMERVEVVCQSMRKHAFAVGQPLLQQLINDNAAEMFDHRAQEGIAAGFRRSAANPVGTSPEELLELVRLQLELREWFKLVVPIILVPPQG